MIVENSICVAVKPISYASPILDDWEKKFTLCSYHKLLERVLGPKNTITKLTASIFQQWKLVLITFNYKLRHIQDDNAIADALSGLP